MYLITFYIGKERTLFTKQVTLSRAEALRAIRKWDAKGHYHVANYEMVEALS